GRGPWAEHQMRPDLVAVHILKPQLRGSGAQFAGVLDPAAVVGGVDRLRSAEADPLAAPHAPGLAVCDPQGRALLLIDDLRRAVAPTASHAPLPQIGGQHVEIEMVVARDEDGFGHDTLRKRSFPDRWQPDRVAAMEKGAPRGAPFAVQRGKPISGR